MVLEPTIWIVGITWIRGLSLFLVGKLHHEYSYNAEFLSIALSSLIKAYLPQCFFDFFCFVRLYM